MRATRETELIEWDGPKQACEIIGNSEVIAMQHYAQLRPDYHRNTHQPARAEDRPNAYQRGYDSDWRKLSKAHLQDNPFCFNCNAFATCVDHRVPIAVDPSRRLDPSNLRSCCDQCHNDLTNAFKATGVNELRSATQAQTRQTPKIQGILISGGRVQHLG